jgi:hypothetical protein
MLSMEQTKMLIPHRRSRLCGGTGVAVSAAMVKPQPNPASA